MPRPRRRPSLSPPTSVVFLLIIVACLAFCPSFCHAAPHTQNHAAEKEDDENTPLKNFPRPPGNGILRHVRLKHESKETGGVCLDGSPAGYYHREGFGEGKSKFLIHYEGGGWCSNDTDCTFRSKDDLGTSKKWWPYMEVADAYTSYFSNATSNPFYNWNLIYMKYCDGSSFSGHVPGAIENVPGYRNKKTGIVRNYTLYYRGQLIHEALFKQFIAKYDLLNATDVVLSGCSAGGLAVYLHIDEVAALFKGRQTKVRGLADSGFFLDQDANGCHAADDIRWLVARQNSPAMSDQQLQCLATYPKPEEEQTSTFSSSSSSSTTNTTVAWKKKAGGEKQLLRRDPSWGLTLAEEEEQATTAHLPRGGQQPSCMFARYLIPSLKTPVFSFVSRYDGAQATSFNCLTGDKVAEMNAAGETFSQIFLDSHKQTNVPHGYLLDGCYRHCFWAQPSDGVSLRELAINPWNNVRGPSKRTAAEIFTDWYQGTGTLDEWREVVEEPYPCPACCGV